MAEYEFRNLSQVEKARIDDQCIFGGPKRRDAALLIAFVAIRNVCLKLRDISR